MEAVDHELLAAAGRGDHAAVAELVCRYHRLVRWRLARLVPVDQVDDLAQEVFLDLAKMIQSRSVAGGPAAAIEVSLAAWLVAVARRKAVNYFRAAQRYAHLLERYQQRLGGEVDEQALLTDSSEAMVATPAEALADCLDRLQLKYREIVDGYYAHGQSAEVLAAHTGRTPGAIRMILMRVRRSLAKCMARRTTSPSPGSSP